MTAQDQMHADTPGGSTDHGSVTSYIDIHGKEWLLILLEIQKTLPLLIFLHRADKTWWFFDDILDINMNHLYHNDLD